MSSVLDTIRSIQESVERIAKQTGTEHLFGNVGYVLGLDEKAKAKPKEEAKKTTPANESQVVDAPDSVSVPAGKSVQETINEILATVNKVAQDSGSEYLLNNIGTILGNVVSGEKEPQNNLVEFEQELSFTSSGVNKNITRYHQALKYRTTDQKAKKTYPYGMECNACCVMYFLQSYGLIPNNISRKQFEYAFTPLNPSYQLIREEDLGIPKSLSGIEIDGHTIKPYEILFNGVLKTSVQDFLKGRSGAIFPHQIGDEILLYNICQNFHNLAFKRGYKFLDEYSQPDLGYYNLNYKGLKNKYEDLVNGITDKEYFKKNVIMVGLAHYPPLPGHYCIIVNNPFATTLNDINFWVYPADDPLYGNTKIFVPKQEITDLTAMANIIDDINNTDKYLIFPNCAIGV